MDRPQYFENNRYTDSIGRVICSENALMHLIMQGADLNKVYSEDIDSVRLFNHYHTDAINIADDITQEDFDQVHTQTWFMPMNYQDMDIQDYLLSKCSTDEQKQRVLSELNIYEQKTLIPVLKQLVYLIDQFRENKIVWGVGRGSSVSSYVLYLIGVHKVDSLKYNLNINDFLK